MNKLIAAVVAAMFALGTVSVFAADAKKEEMKKEMKKEEAKKEYPQCARLKIEHGKAKFAWDMILNAIDKKRKENEK